MKCPVAWPALRYLLPAFCLNALSQVVGCLPRDEAQQADVSPAVIANAAEERLPVTAFGWNGLRLRPRHASQGHSPLSTSPRVHHLAPMERSSISSFAQAMSLDVAEESNEELPVTVFSWNGLPLPLQAGCGEPDRISLHTGPGNAILLLSRTEQIELFDRFTSAFLPPLPTVPTNGSIIMARCRSGARLMKSMEILKTLQLCETERTPSRA